MKVLIGVITYNRLKLLQECFQSIEAAAPKRYRILISDDASTDGTQEWLSGLHNDRAVTLLSTTRGGVARNSNRVIKYARDRKYDLVFLLNDDVLVKPDAFEVYATAIDQTRYSHFCYTDARSQFQPSEEFEDGSVKLVRRITGDGAFLTITKAMIEELGGFDTEFGLFGGEHIDYSRRAALAGFAKDNLDVAAARDLIKVRQYYESIMPALGRARSGHLQQANDRFIELASEEPVLFKEL